MDKFTSKQFCITGYGESELEFENVTLFYDKNEFIKTTLLSIANNETSMVCKGKLHPKLEIYREIVKTDFGYAMISIENKEEVHDFLYQDGYDMGPEMELLPPNRDNKVNMRLEPNDK